MTDPDDDGTPAVPENVGDEFSPPGIIPADEEPEAVPAEEPEDPTEEPSDDTQPQEAQEAPQEAGEPTDG